MSALPLVAHRPTDHIRPLHFLFPNTLPLPLPVFFPLTHPSPEEKKPLTGSDARGGGGLPAQMADAAPPGTLSRARLAPEAHRRAGFLFGVALKKGQFLLLSDSVRMSAVAQHLQKHVSGKKNKEEFRQSL